MFFHLRANVHCDLMHMPKPIVKRIIDVVLELSVCIQIRSNCPQLAPCVLHPGLNGHKRLLDVLRVIIVGGERSLAFSMAHLGFY